MLPKVVNLRRIAILQAPNCYEKVSPKLRTPRTGSGKFLPKTTEKGEKVGLEKYEFRRKSEQLYIGFKLLWGGSPHTPGCSPGVGRFAPHLRRFARRVFRGIPRFRCVFGFLPLFGLGF